MSEESETIAAATERETLDLPGIGEVRARRGTSTLELAGGIKYWHDRYQDAQDRIWAGRREGFIGGSVCSTLLITACYAVCYLLRK